MKRIEDAGREERRRILRRSAIFTYGFALSAVAVAFGGTAPIAWLLTRGPLPFLQTWLVLGMLVLGAPAAILAFRQLRNGA